MRHGAVLEWLRAAWWRFVLEPIGMEPWHISWATERIPRFFLILLLLYVATRVLVWTLSKTVLSPRRVDPMLASLLKRLLQAVLMFVGLSVALLVFGVNILDLALALGLVGAALALGLQNTVANIMGGISLVTDRPFEVGDRIEIGEFWGDVEEIGLRSTRILTARREFVIVPNRLMDEREIWNYTKRYPELRIELDTSISYDSDIDRARTLMKNVARRHDEVLSFPRPRILVRGFLDNGVEMELQCYIADARERYRLSSELRRSIKLAFDEHGVEIPYPYRTLVDKKDLPKPKQGADPEAPEEPMGPRRLLVATAGTGPALRKADTIVKIAQRLDADIVLTYIAPRTSIASRREGEKAASIFQTCARRHDVEIQLIVQSGDIVDTVKDVAQRNRCGAVIIGGSPAPVLMAWKHADVAERLRRALDIPIIVVPPDLDVDEDEIQAAQQALSQQDGAAEETT